MADAFRRARKFTILPSMLLDRTTRETSRKQGKCAPRLLEYMHSCEDRFRGPAAEGSPIGTPSKSTYRERDQRSATVKDGWENSRGDLAIRVEPVSSNPLRPEFLFPSLGGAQASRPYNFRANCATIETKSNTKSPPH